MAVKGKSRSGAAPGAPKPKVEPRKLPLRKRPGFRKGAVVIGVLLILLIAGSVWGRVSRANDLEAYDRALTVALRPFQKHNETGSPTHIGDNVRQIGGGELSAKEITDLTTQWEKDITASRDAIGKLTPPEELALANKMYSEVMDDYIGIARMAKSIADERTLAAKVDGRAVKAEAQRQVTAWQSALQEWLGRADKRRGEAVAAVNALKADWGIDEAA